MSIRVVNCTVHISAAYRAFGISLARVINPYIDTMSRILGYPTPEELAQRRRIDRHMQRCEMRRKRRRKQRR